MSEERAPSSPRTSDARLAPTSPLARAWAHMRALWPAYTLFPVLPFVAWPAYRLASGIIRWDYVGFLILPTVLAYATPTTKRLLIALYPLGLVALFYDAMKLIQNLGVSPETVHDCDLRALDVRFFGITWNGQRTTLHDWLQAHASPALDLYFAIPYGTFIYAAIGFAVFLWWKDFRAVQRFGWSFLLLNIAGFATYHVYPAAPPWYYHAHGCVIDMAAKASEGPNLARVDAMLGISYFKSFYGRASDVFGAVPSLHVAYPLLIVLEGWRHFGRVLRAAAVAFFVSMCCAAVYLDHHWVVDVVVGISYCLILFFVMRRVPGLRPVGEPSAASGSEAAPAGAPATVEQG